MKKLSLVQRLNRRLGTLLFIATLSIALFLRVYHLHSLPPGIHPGEAQWLQSALNVAKHPSAGLLFGSTHAGYSLYMLLLGIAALVSKTVFSFRLLNAVLGVILVAGVYVWGKDWFGRRAGLIASFLLAVSPWAITLSRDIWPVNLALVCLVWLCYFAGRAYREGRKAYVAVAVLFLLAGCVSSRIFWLVPVFCIVVFILAALQKKLSTTRLKLALVVASVLLVVSTAFFGISALRGVSPAQGIVHSSLGSSSHANISTKAKLALDGAVSTGLSFFVRGDEDYTRNLGGLPMLNSFVGLMFLLGVLLSVWRLHRLHSITLLVGLGVMLLPGLLTAASVAPDSYRTALAIPFVFVLAGVGTNYLLASWYGIFPVNTTVRTLGLSLVITLMALSFYQGYRQYFVAWAQDPQTYRAYREDLVRERDFLETKSGKTFVVGSPEDLGAIMVLRERSEESVLGGNVESLESLPVASKPASIVLSLQKDAEAAKKRIIAKYPKAKYHEERSEFDARPLYGWYEVQ